MGSSGTGNFSDYSGTPKQKDSNGGGGGAYSLDAALLYERGELALVALYVIGSVVLSIAGLFAGLALVRHFT